MGQTSLMSNPCDAPEQSDVEWDEEKGAGLFAARFTLNLRCRRALGDERYASAVGRLSQ